MGCRNAPGTNRGQGRVYDGADGLPLIGQSLGRLSGPSVEVPSHEDD
jgi:hypothetical protein